MKKTAIFFLALILSFNLCGCSELSKIDIPDPPQLNENEKEELINTSDVETEVPTVSEEATDNGTVLNDELVKIYISSSSFAKNINAPDDDNEVILHYEYYTPHINITGNDAASDSINEFLSNFDEIYYSGNDVFPGFNYYYENALDNYSYVKGTGSEINTEFYTVRMFRCTRCDSIISLVFYVYEYSGNQNDVVSTYALNFDSATGKILQTEDVFNDNQAFIDAAQEYLKELLATDEYSTVNITAESTESAIIAISGSNGWYFTQEGLSLVSVNNEYTDSNSRQITFSIPYSYLTDCLNNGYVLFKYPVTGDGEYSVNVFSYDDYEGSYDIVDMIIADPDGDSCFITIDGTIYDLNISRVEYNDGEGIFYDTESLWFSNAASDCAVQVKMKLPEGIPEIIISYIDDSGAEHKQLIASEGFDAKLVIKDTDMINPVG